MPSSGPLWILAQKFPPGLIFLHPVRKKHSFPPEQIWLGGTFPLHFNASQPHIFFMCVCVIHRSWLHTLSFPHLYTQYYTWRTISRKTLNRTETQQSTSTVQYHFTERRHTNQQLLYINISFPSKYQIALVIKRTYSLSIIKAASRTIISSNVTSKMCLSFFSTKR